MMSETQNATTAERIALSIGERIISGALQPDAPLRQDHIAREFGSSHVPVREAFRKLGYKKVAVLDEGILAWRDRGYPTHAGAKP